MFFKVMMLSLAISQLSSAMDSNGQTGQQKREPIPEKELKLFLGKEVEYQLSVDGICRTGRFGGRFSKEKFSIVYTEQGYRGGITVDNDKIYKIPSGESDIKK